MSADPRAHRHRHSMGISIRPSAPEVINKPIFPKQKNKTVYFKFFGNSKREKTVDFRFFGKGTKNKNTDFQKKLGPTWSSY